MKKLLLVVLLLIPREAISAEINKVIHLKPNAKATRDFHFGSKSWVDRSDKPTTRFNTNLNDKEMALKEKFILNMNSSHPKIISKGPINRFAKDIETTEWKPNVIHKTDDMTIFMWSNPFNNKVWILSINTKHNAAIVTQFYNGATSFGVEVETLNE